MWKGEGTNRLFSKVCRDWHRALGCCTQTGFDPRKTIFLCSWFLRLTSTVHLRSASSVLSILQTSHAVFKTTPVPSPFYKGGSQKNTQVHGGILWVLDLNDLLTSGLLRKVVSDCCLHACLFTTLPYSLNQPNLGPLLVFPTWEWHHYPPNCISQKAMSPL